MTDQTVFQDFLGETVKAAFAEQERVIGTLPKDSQVLELPEFAKWLIVHPTEPVKAITMDGRLVTLDGLFLSSPSIRQESEAE